MADRYLYVPLLGVVVALVWEVAEAIPQKRSTMIPAAAAAAACVLVLAAVSRNQLGHWKTSVDLFRHAAAVSPDSAIARSNCGASLLDIRAAAAAEGALGELGVEPPGGLRPPTDRTATGKKKGSGPPA